MFGRGCARSLVMPQTTCAMFLQLLLGTFASSQSIQEDLAALVACCLIPFDNCLGIRPIVVDKVCRSGIVKPVIHAVKDNLTHAAGALQVCAG